MTTPRRFNVYKSQHLVLFMEDTPGVLLSTAPPPPRGPSPHPWINAQAYDPYSEHELGTLVRKAQGFDDFLTMLLANDYDIVSHIDSRPDDRERPHRIYDGDTLIGTCSANKGQFTTLRDQPAPDDLIFSHVALTAYDPQFADELLGMAHETTDFDGLLVRLGKRFSVQALSVYMV